MINGVLCKFIKENRIIGTVTVLKLGVRVSVGVWICALGPLSKGMKLLESEPLPQGNHTWL